MNSKELIQAVAELWVSNGGDADGINFCWVDIRNAVQELINNQEVNHE